MRAGSQVPVVLSTQQGTNSHLQADDADISMVLITGITKFLPPAEVLISPLSLKGVTWGQAESRAKRPRSMAEL